jgi:hypothetical protein
MIMGCVMGSAVPWGSDPRARSFLIEALGFDHGT